MKFSGKITNAILVFVRQEGGNLEDLSDFTEIPTDFLHDPTTWMEAPSVEHFLESIERWWLAETHRGDLFEAAGHASKSLQAWGVLDSVLRMIAKPQDIFYQPQRFLSYFISPAPPIGNLRRTDRSVTFDLPIFYEEYPRVVSYLKATMESLPQYMGAPMADVKWQQNRLNIVWESESSLLSKTELDKRQMAPEVMAQLIQSLEQTEMALLEKTKELDRIRSENIRAAQSRTLDLEEVLGAQEKLEHYSQQVLKLQDYFTRSSQLITLLVGQDRLSPQVREAMRRVDWEQVQQSFPQVTRELLDDIQGRKKTITEEEHHGSSFSNQSKNDSGQSWLPNC